MFKLVLSGRVVPILMFGSEDAITSISAKAKVLDRVTANKTEIAKIELEKLKFKPQLFTKRFSITSSHQPDLSFSDYTSAIYGQQKCLVQVQKIKMLQVLSY